MDFQGFVDTCSVPCAVLSVERLADGTCGQVRIVRANQPYKAIMGPKYYDNMPYEELVPKDNKFEDFCFRAAFMDKRMHAYVQTKALGTWTDQLMIPLLRESESLGYCQFLFEFTTVADPERMASVSIDTATEVIKASITLLNAEDFRVAVWEVLGDIIRISGAFGSRIMLVDHVAHTATNFCERLRDDIDPDELPGDGIIPYQVVRSWDAMVGVSNSVIVKSEEDMSRIEVHNPAWVRDMRDFGVRTLVLMPLRREKNTIGYLYVTNFDPERVVEVKELLELMSYILGSEISNYLLLRSLEQLSSVDALTGLLNRNAMISTMSNISRMAGRTQFGVINLDLNGLKSVNDRYGHDAGDRMLVEAAEILGKVFHHEDVYRTGGDEFIVLLPNIEREVFERKLRQLDHAVNKNHDVSFAIGSCWTDGSMDIRTAYRHADNSMYENKRAYYETYPERKTRR